MEQINQKDLEFMCGGKKIRLNIRLVNRQGLTFGDIALIKSLHKKKAKLFKKMTAETEASKIKAYAKQAKELEFLLQEAWGFPKDESFHPWYEVPHCSCAKLDNQDYRGTKYKSISSDCIVHSQGE